MLSNEVGQTANKKIEISKDLTVNACHHHSKLKRIIEFDGVEWAD